MLSVCETFSSIQGESTHAGRPCFFIRLAGCSCSCAYCDTEYAKAPGKEYSLPELLMLARNSGMKLVEVTGGEPMEQRETPLLCRGLLDAGFEVLLETNGTDADPGKANLEIRVRGIADSYTNVVPKELHGTIDVEVFMEKAGVSELPAGVFRMEVQMELPEGLTTAEKYYADVRITAPEEEETKEDHNTKEEQTKEEQTKEDHSKDEQ